MLDFFAWVGLIVLFVLFSGLRKTIASLQAEISDLDYQLTELRDQAATKANVREEPAAAELRGEATKQAQPEPTRVEPVTHIPSEPETAYRSQSGAADQILPPPLAAEPEEYDEENYAGSPSAAKRFEDLIGGKLPIWIGGIALIFAGFFLVRFSIESGLFGPAARCVTAALFGLLLISLSEFGSRIPRFGQIFSDDVRIGHSISGAGIAVLYATLYMASELYGLLSLNGALIGMVSVTLLAFFLSQKHGPPTAIMALLGGFSAPYVAGLGPESVTPLLIYLTVFMAGVFGLAIHRGWAWLALLATAGAAIWTTALLMLGVAGDAGPVGLFITILAIAGVLTIGRTGTSFGLPKPIIQSIPLGIGLIQLMMLLPLIEFSLVGWIFFAILSLFSIALAWRDSNMTPSVPGALALSVVMVAVAFTTGKTGMIEGTAAIGFALLFTIAGHVWALRKEDGWLWAICAIAAPTAMMAVTTTGNFDWSDSRWAALCLIVAIPNGLMAWRTKNGPHGLLMPLATAVTATLVLLALWLWTTDAYAAIMAGLVAATLAVWARYTGRAMIAAQSVMAGLLSGLLMLVSAYQLVMTLLASLAGETDLYSGLPAVSDMIAELLVPTLILLGNVAIFRDIFESKSLRLLMIFGITGFGGFLYLLAKQPLAIGPIQDFVTYGFAERAVFTHALALGAWLLLWRNWPDDKIVVLRSLGLALAGLALFRFLYFDIFLLSPTALKQLLGTAPIANLGTLHYAGAAVWLWLFSRIDPVGTRFANLPRLLAAGSLLASIAAVMITVRQMVHGSDIATPPFTSSETYLYSAGLLILAIVWLARGIQSGNALLRIGGLLLLTVVTLKVFLFDANQLDGILRIISFLGLGIALIGIGWIYGKVMKNGEPQPAET